MNVANKTVEDMLKAVDPQSRKVMANILTGKIVSKIYCLSEDVFEDKEVPLIKGGVPIYYKTGKKAGQQQTTKMKVMTREGCKGRHIGDLYEHGVDSQGNAVYRAEAVKADDGQFYLRSTRMRMDGVMGCECWCGQDSRIALQEAGDITFNGQPPTKEGIMNIFNRIQKNPTIMKIKNGKSVVDGFAFEEIR